MSVKPNEAHTPRTIYENMCYFFKLRCVRLYAWVLFGIQTYFCNGARTVQLTAAMTKGLTSSRFEFNHVCICQKISFSF